ncbi:MAG: NAD(P)-binding domain-containing protein [Opitutaceae bacterium]|nr:NAD(P)-binding domain-containing protein [Opitutaceae bacterium]
MHQATIIYLIPLIIILVVYFVRKNNKHSSSNTVKKDAIKAGLIEPSSLHPVIDPVKCLGCATCVSACPEAKNKVLGVIKGKAELINPTNCIGHGACKTACPFDAISLVFGTERRGMDIPNVSPTFETNMNGIYIAGELGGMGLIRNAVEQGKQAMEHLCGTIKNNSENEFDVLIVGSGPAGISASLKAKEKGAKYITIEQDSLGGTVAHFPRGKLVMTTPVDLPLYGKVNFTETTKEALLSLWRKIVQEQKLNIHYEERIDAIKPTKAGYKVTTNKNEYLTNKVLLSIGRRGTPRKLNVPGEEQSKVVYRLIDPEQYKEMHVLVVGGGDSALEAATSIAEQEGSVVSISYRSASFSRAKEKNRKKVGEQSNDGRLNIYLQSTVNTINEHDVVLNVIDGEKNIKNDIVIVCAGGILPTPFLEETGITVEKKFGTA